MLTEHLTTTFDQWLANFRQYETCLRNPRGTIGCTKARIVRMLALSYEAGRYAEQQAHGDVENAENAVMNLKELCAFLN